MNDLIGNNYEPTEEQLKAKKLMKIVGVILILLFLVSIGLVALMYYIQATELKISIDGVGNTNLESILIFDENGKVYIPIRRFADFVNYDSYNGNESGEDPTKCYVTNNYENTYFTINSNKIYKKLENSSEYEYFTIDEQVKMINDELYTTIDGAKKAFNISFEYNTNNNEIVIYTLPYLVKYWSGRFTNSAIISEDASFNNQKALLYGMIIVQNENNYYGVYDLSGKEILGTKYKSIKFTESNQEFIVTTAENKMGIISYDATTKISPIYDQIKQIDKDSGLYLVTDNKKQGVINSVGSIIIYLEYDQIGVDITKYSNDDIKNQYLLYDNCIPVKQNNKWGIFDKSGREILKVEYDNLGCTSGANTNKSSSSNQVTNANNILLVPDLEAIVVEKDKLYGLIDSNGKELLPTVFTSMYSITSGGTKTYHMVYENEERNIVDYVKKYILKTTPTEDAITNETNTNTVDENIVNNTNQNTTNANNQNINNQKVENQVQ